MLPCEARVCRQHQVRGGWCLAYKGLVNERCFSYGSSQLKMLENAFIYLSYCSATVNTVPSSFKTARQCLYQIFLPEIDVLESFIHLSCRTTVKRIWGWMEKLDCLALKAENPSMSGFSAPFCVGWISWIYMSTWMRCLILSRWHFAPVHRPSGCTSLEETSFFCFSKKFTVCHCQ